MSDPVATALTLASLRAQRDEMKAAIEQASAALALAGFGGDLLAQVGAVLAKVERLEARKVALCLCVDYRIHCKGGDPQYCQSGHDHETVGPRDGCRKCKGSGAVIVEPNAEGAP